MLFEGERAQLERWQKEETVKDHCKINKFCWEETWENSILNNTLWNLSAVLGTELTFLHLIYLAPLLLTSDTWICMSETRPYKYLSSFFQKDAYCDYVAILRNSQSELQFSSVLNFPLHHTVYSGLKWPPSRFYVMPGGHKKLSRFICWTGTSIHMKAYNQELYPE